MPGRKVLAPKWLRMYLMYMPYLTYYLVGGVKGKLTQPRPKTASPVRGRVIGHRTASHVRNQKDKPGTN